MRPGSTIYAEVGGNGAPASPAPQQAAAGGANGGMPGGAFYTTSPLEQLDVPLTSGGGGGASDLQSCRWRPGSRSTSARVRRCWWPPAPGPTPKADTYQPAFRLNAGAARSWQGKLPWRAPHQQGLVIMLRNRRMRESRTMATYTTATWPHQGAHRPPEWLKHDG